ncbi:MAG: hypothetical protein Q9187_006878 [Circinaria calcarea]
MASLLRQIVAGPRLRNPEAGLDLCYVTENIIVTSGPSSTYPQRAYRNPTDSLVKFLDYKHKTHWSIWEFRAEGTGYPDSEVHGRIRHYPWPDHHPPPFAIIPNIMASMRNWLRDPDAAADGRVVVVHCKAGKGRSGTVACSYLISEEGWKAEDALSRFTERRMRVGFGAGVSIPSQLRWVSYVDRWTKYGKMYVERQVEILEVHAWGLRDGVKVSIQGFVDEGRTIKTFHVFDKQERILVDNTTHFNGHFAEPTDPVNEKENLATSQISNTTKSFPTSYAGSEVGGPAVIFRPSTRVVLPSNDINIDFERRNRATYGWTMVTAVAHVWFNAYFEGLGPENSGSASPSGVFEIHWDAMDGIKGSSRKGTRALDRLAVVWRVLDAEEGSARVVPEPKAGEPVPEMEPADWKGANKGSGESRKELGMKAESPGSVAMSKASSLEDIRLEQTIEDDDELAGVQTHGSDDSQNGVPLDATLNFDGSPRLSSEHGSREKVGLGTVAEIVSGMKHIRTNELPGGRPEEEMKTSEQSSLGKISRERKP